MPDSNQFKNGFGFNEGTKYGNFIISNTNINESTVKRWEEYSYIIDITFKCDNPTAEQINFLKNLILEKTKITMTIYGKKNPYKCSISEEFVPTPINGGIIFHFKGNALRIGPLFHRHKKFHF